MKTIFTIFINDLKSAAKNIIVFIVIIGISILPALYAWFNIAANWDPYSNTGGIPFAVCSLDKGASLNILFSVNAGDKILEELKKNDKMGWDFVDEQTAVDGVKDGKYYAAVVIPENFSEELMSVLSGKFQQAELHYYINEKKNAITPKITKAGIEAVQESVNSSYVNTIITMVASSLNLATTSLDSTVDGSIDRLVSSLKEIQGSVDGLKTAIDVVISSVDTVESTVEASKDKLPDINNSLSKAGTVADSLKDSVLSAKTVTAGVTDSIDELLASAEGFSVSVKSGLEQAFAQIDEDAGNTADALAGLTEPGKRIITIAGGTIESLLKIEEKFGIDLSDVTVRLDNTIEKWENINDSILDVAGNVNNSGAYLDEVSEELYSMLSSADKEISEARTSFARVKNSIDKAIDKVYVTVNNAAGFLESLGNDIPDYGKTMDNANNTLENMKATLENTKTFLDSSKDKIGGLISTVEKLRDSDTVVNMISPIIENPEALGEYVSSPSKTVTERMFPVDNYGTGMTPFYSTLAFWVGGIILVAVLRTDLLKREEKKLSRVNATQMFFGRYIIFFMLGQIQALIISLGDLFFLKIQCDDPALFIAGSLISSFVYTLLIYSLTITFSVIGKALAVIILVIQIAGSGGTFPAEVLPEPFRAVSPFLPFKYGIDMLREAVAGVDASAYIHNMLYLLIFVPVALFLGLFLRRPCIKAIAFFNKRIEQSDLVI